MRTGVNMRGTGITIWLMGMDSTYAMMALLMRESGLWIDSMGGGSRPGKIRVFMRDTS